MADGTVLVSELSSGERVTSQQRILDGNASRYKEDFDILSVEQEFLPAQVRGASFAHAAAGGHVFDLESRRISTRA